MINQHSLSDAEDFTEGYRAMKLGKVVGEPTAGWIIYTWNVTLMDGSQLRLPRTRITDLRGREHGAQSAAGGHCGHAPDRRELHGDGQRSSMRR